MGFSTEGTFLPRLQKTKNLANELYDIIEKEGFGIKLLWQACLIPELKQILASKAAKMQYWGIFDDYPALGFSTQKNSLTFDDIFNYFCESDAYKEYVQNFKNGQIQLLYEIGNEQWDQPDLGELQNYYKDCKNLMQNWPIVARLCFTQCCLAMAKTDVKLTTTAISEAKKAFEEVTYMSARDDLTTFLNLQKDIIYLGEKVDHLSEIKILFEREIEKLKMPENIYSCGFKH